MTGADQPATVAATERWFERRGIPHFIAGYNAAEDIFTRVLPLLTFVFLLSVAGALQTEWRWWQNLLVGAGGLGLLIGLWAALNRVRGRPALARPRRVGRTELAAFVLVPAVVPLVFGGRLGSALRTAAAMAAVLAVIYVATSFGVLAMTRWAAGRTVRSLGSVLGLFTRALPLLLLFFMFLFINAEAWQVAGGLETPALAGVLALFVGLGAAFLVARLPAEIGDLTRFSDWAEVRRLAAGSPLGSLAGGPAGRPDPPRLTRREWGNVGLVVLFNQGIQIVLVGALIGGFFVAFGLLTIAPDTIASWTGSAPEVIRRYAVADLELVLTAQLLRVAGFLAAFSGLYFSVYLSTDPTFRAEFFEDVVGEVREALAVRAVYRRLVA